MGVAGAGLADARGTATDVARRVLRVTGPVSSGMAQYERQSEYTVTYRSG